MWFGSRVPHAAAGLGLADRGSFAPADAVLEVRDDNPVARVSKAALSNMDVAITGMHRSGRFSLRFSCVSSGPCDKIELRGSKCLLE